MKFISWHELAKGGEAAADVAAALRPGQYIHEMSYCCDIPEEQAKAVAVRLVNRELGGETITCIPESRHA